MNKIRVVTLKKDIPEGTVSHSGFHLLNMGAEGMWLVDEDHPGYKRCVIQAMQIAAAKDDKVLVDRYSALPKGKDPKKFAKLPSVLEREKKEREAAAAKDKEEKADKEAAKNK